MPYVSLVASIVATLNTFRFELIILENSTSKGFGKIVNATLSYRNLPTDNNADLTNYDSWITESPFTILRRMKSRGNINTNDDSIGILRIIKL